MKVPFLSKRFQIEKTTITETSYDIAEEFDDNLNIQFGDAKEDVTPPTSTDDISSVITTGTDAPNQLFIESNEVTLRNLERFSKIDFVEAEFESGG